jgi:hypothetical protein
MFVRFCTIAFPLPADAPVILPRGLIVIVHENVVAGVGLVSEMLVVPGEQKVWEEGVAVTDGDGFTVTTTFIGSPGHPLAVGVIV